MILHQIHTLSLALSDSYRALSEAADGKFVSLQNPYVDTLTPMRIVFGVGPGGVIRVRWGHAGGAPMMVLTFL